MIGNLPQKKKHPLQYNLTIQHPPGNQQRHQSTNDKLTQIWRKGSN